MQKKSTPISTISSVTGVSSDRNTVRLAPRESTLSFLRQFARVYHFEAAITGVPRGMILN